MSTDPQSPPDSSRPDVDADVLDLFDEFPVPLLLLYADGRPPRGNRAFEKAFRIDGLSHAQRVELTRAAGEHWQDVDLTDPDGSTTRVRAWVVPASSHVLLVVRSGDTDARAAELERLRERIGTLEEAASTDHLTGAWNRAHLDRVIGPEIARSLSTRQPLSLILADIDRFKNVNDTYGHAVGDAVLKELVARLRASVRTSDLVFRWGGEEFVVLLAGLGYRGAERVAEALRAAVSDRPFETIGPLTISVGVAEHDGDEDAEAWFRRVDEALYEAKAGGRDRVVVAQRGNSDAWAAGGAAALHLTWLESFESGDPEIDAEHREIFQLTNALIESMAQAGPAKELLDRLLVHVQSHFAHEESILEALNYEGLAEHRRSHAGLLRRALTLAGQMTSGDAGLGALVEFVALDVVLRHMVTVDRAYFPLVAGRARKAAETPR